MTVRMVPVADGSTFAVRLGGPESGPPLLMLSGQANSGRWWDDIRGGFEDADRTVSFDWRGSGETECDLSAWKNWTAETFAADAMAVMSALGYARYAVYGTSMGGRVAQHLAADHPEVLTHLILACTTPGGPNDVAASFEVRELLGAPSSPERTAAVISWFYTPSWRGSSGGSKILGDPLLTREGLRGHRRVSNGHDAWDKLPRITTPTLVVHGSDDPMTPVENAHLIAERIPHAQLHVHPGGRHGFFDEFSADLAPLLRGFLAS